jgi:RIO-like serine/threonine protein kinase
VFSTELASVVTRFHRAEETMMKDAKTYREYAADCRRMAKLTSSKDKEVLMKMAEAWEERAQEAERAASKE